MRTLCDNPLCSHNAEVAATTYRGGHAETLFLCKECAYDAGAHLIESLPETEDE